MLVCICNIVKWVYTCVCEFVWVMCACRLVCVKRKSPIQSPVWERGSTLSHSAGGKLLSLSFGGGKICISCHPPFSFFFCRLRSRTEAAGSSSSEEIGENAAQSCCLPPGTTQSRSHMCCTVETKSSRNPVHVGHWSGMPLACDRLLALIRFH